MHGCIKRWPSAGRRRRRPEKGDMSEPGRGEGKADHDGRPPGRGPSPKRWQIPYPPPQPTRTATRKHTATHSKDPGQAVGGYRLR
jgi:hypothetical protein